MKEQKRLTPKALFKLNVGLIRSMGYSVNSFFYDKEINFKDAVSSGLWLYEWKAKCQIISNDDGKIIDIETKTFKSMNDILDVFMKHDFMIISLTTK